MAAFRQFRRRYLPFLPTAAQTRATRNRLLRSIGFARSHVPRMLVRRPELCAGSMLRYVAAEVALQAGEIRLLQIGAFDGVTDDDLREVIQNYPVRGVLVEPQPAVYARLQENYRDHSQLTLVNAAVDRQSGSREFHTTATQYSSCASFDRDHLRKHGVRDRDIKSQQVECLTVPELLDRCGMDGVDLIQIDAEGYDYEIIKSIDLDQLSPAIIRFEFAHFSKRDLDECLQMLASRGYRFLVENKDVIAIGQSRVAASRPVVAA